MRMIAVPRAADLLEQREDLGLHGDVECGGRLVGDQQRGVERERRGDERALAQAAREFAGAARARRSGLWHADCGEQLDALGGRARPGRPSRAGAGSRRSRADGTQRIERDERVLQDEPDLPPAHAAPLAVGRSERTSRPSQAELARPGPGSRDRPGRRASGPSPTCPIPTRRRSRRTGRAAGRTRRRRRSSARPRSSRTRPRDSARATGAEPRQAVDLVGEREARGIRLDDAHHRSPFSSARWAYRPSVVVASASTTITRPGMTVSHPATVM